MSKSPRRHKQTVAIEYEEGPLLTLAKKFYIRRFPQEEEPRTGLTREDFMRIARQVSRPKEPET